MICSDFKAALSSGEQTEETLAHMRACSSCLELAVTIDPDNLFRSLGGAALEPVGGIEAFVGDVMHEIHLRKTELQVARQRRTLSAPWRWAAAAAIGAVALTTSLTIPAWFGGAEPGIPTPATTVARASIPQPVVTRPVVESYDSGSATIIEVPTDSTPDDLRVVMIFDENLPTDL